MNPALEALGCAPDERVVIVHVDDVGMCHGANQAYLALSRAGAVTSGSVMVPCPWFPDLAAAAAGDPALDLGGVERLPLSSMLVVIFGATCGY